MPSEGNKGKTTVKNKKTPQPQEECGKCDANLRRSDKTVRCTTCSTKFHTACQNVSDTMYELISDETENGGIYWFCHICRKSTRGVFNTLANLEVRLQAIESEKGKDQNKLKDTSNKVEALQNFCQVLETEIQQLKENNEKTLQTVSNLRRDLFNEHDKNIFLQSRIDQLEQTQRDCNVRVMGFPELGESDTTIKHQFSSTRRWH